MPTETKETNEQKQIKVYNLSIELAQVVNSKKEANRGFNDEIKRIKAEIDEIIGDEV